MSFQQTVKIPRDRIGAIIGKSGKVKGEIEEKCKVHIDIDSETGEATIRSANPEEQSIENVEMFRAAEVVAAISRGFSPQRAYRLLGSEDLLQEIELRDYAGKSSNALERIKGRIIGEGGKSRRTIEELTGASISVYGHTVSMIGSYKEVKLATDAITMLSKGSMHKSVYTMLQDARRKEKLDRMRLWEDSYGIEASAIKEEKEEEE
jgi:ribosomal RNA assembly protein